MIYASIHYEDGYTQIEKNPKKLHGLKREGKRPILIGIYYDGVPSDYSHRDKVEIKDCIYKQLTKAVVPIKGKVVVDERTRAILELPSHKTVDEDGYTVMTKEKFLEEVFTPPTEEQKNCKHDMERQYIRLEEDMYSRSVVCTKCGLRT